MAGNGDPNISASTRSKYDVFLSFRGKDTRKTFTDHLYAALVRAGIHTFRDDDEIESGGEIGPECLKAIEESRFSIVVLSKGYASSTWCLDELVHILECRKSNGHRVWPVFYDVDPSHVEELNGSFGEAFSQHEKQYLNKDTLEKWKAALKEIAYLKGLDLPNHADGHEAKNIDNIVEVISRTLTRTKLSVATNPVGLHSHAIKVISLLGDESVDVRMVGIYGMGGMGKTTIAKEVYNTIFDKFEGSSFLENIRQQSDLIMRLQRQLLSETLKRKHEKIYTADGGLNVIRDRLHLKRVLIVLDDVEEPTQLYKILGNYDWLYPGSRVIITTRTKDLLKPSTLYQQYGVDKMNDTDSLQLLSLHAFGNYDPSEEYLDCARRVVSYAGGVPLALEVLGSSLFNQNIDVWNSRLEKLKIIGDKKIHKILEISYDSLDDMEKFLFLDIACFFIGKDKDFVMSILDGCGFHTTDGINTLKKRCLLNIGSYNKLMMHDLLRDMGREIVRRESVKDPGKRSRLWHHEDVIDVVYKKKGTDAVEGIILDQRGEKQSFNTKAFKRMTMLRLLQLNYAYITGSCKYISSNLRWLCWHEFPLESIPFDLNLANLIVLDMRYSSLKQFSEEVKSLMNLKLLNLSHSHELIRTPNFEGLPLLEKLMLKDCINLVEVHESVGLLARLVFLNLQDCKSLHCLPRSICALSSLEKLNMSGCSKLEELPEDLGNMKSLVELLADRTSICMLPETIGNLEKLKTLSLCECGLLFSPRKCQYTISYLPSSLKKLDLRHCNILDDAIPHDLQGLSLLEDLKLCGNNFTSLPVSIGRLDKLHTLWLNECKRLKSIPQLRQGVSSLHAKSCSSLESINLTNFLGESDLELDGCLNLKEIEGFFNLEPLGAEIVTELFKRYVFFAQEAMANIQLLRIDNLTQTYRTSPLQALSERGLYSIFLPRVEIPMWFSHQNEGDTVSFRVPPLHQCSKIIGFATCAIYSWKRSSESCYFMPNNIIVNRTKGFHWEYTPYVTFFSTGVEEDILWLCYWMFDNLVEGIDEFDMSWRFKDEMDEGDLIEFSVDMGFGILVRKCGICLLYRPDDHSASGSKDLTVASWASSRHRKRFLKSFPRWLSIYSRQKITSQVWKDPSPLMLGYNDFLRWSKLRQQRVDQMPDYDPKYADMEKVVKPISSNIPARLASALRVPSTISLSEGAQASNKPSPPMSTLKLESSSKATSTLKLESSSKVPPAHSSRVARPAWFNSLKSLAGGSESAPVSSMRRPSKESILKAFQELQALFDQGPERVAQGLGALKDPLQILKNLTEEDGITAGEKDRFYDLEKRVNMVVGRMFSAGEEKKEVDLKIQTFNQRSTKAIELIAVCEKMESDLDSMGAEVETLKSQIEKLQEQLTAVEKRREDVSRGYGSLIAELEPLHVQLQNLKDANLEEQKVRAEVSEQNARRAWEDIEKEIAEAVTRFSMN